MLKPDVYDRTTPEARRLTTQNAAGLGREVERANFLCRIRSKQRIITGVLSLRSEDPKLEKI